MLLSLISFFNNISNKSLCIIHPDQGLLTGRALVKLVVPPAEWVAVSVCGAVVVPVGGEDVGVDVEHAERVVFLAHAPADGGPGGGRALGHDAGVDDARRQGRDRDVRRVFGRVFRLGFRFGYKVASRFGFRVQIRVCLICIIVFLNNVFIITILVIIILLIIKMRVYLDVRSVSIHILIVVFGI